MDSISVSGNELTFDIETPTGIPRLDQKVDISVGQCNSPALQGAFGNNVPVIQHEIATNKSPLVKNTGQTRIDEFLLAAGH